MKAVRLHGYDQMPVIEDVPEPSIQSPLDVIVKIGGAGVCRTDRSTPSRSASTKPNAPSEARLPASTI